MRPVLGIELGPSRCVLVLVDDGRETRGSLHVVAHFVVEYEDSVSLARQLRQLRIAQRLPRRARVVIWPEAGDAGVTPVDLSRAAHGFTPDLWRLRDRLRPIVRAGFRIGGALSPAQAVAALVSLASTPSVVAGLAVDARAGALVVVRDGVPLVARDLAWKFAAPAADAALLDRYVFVAQMLPHLTQVVEAARAQHGARVDRVVLCGPAPALRALAAPLIEELDLEVETLDGLSGVAVDGDPDAAAAAQLGAGAAIAPPDASVIPGLGGRPALTPARVALGVAAAAAVIVLVLLFWPARQAPRSHTATRGAEKPKPAGSLARPGIVLGRLVAAGRSGRGMAMADPSR